MLKKILEVYWTTTQPFWTHKRRLFFLFFAGIGWKYIHMTPDVGDTRGQFWISQCLVFHQICEQNIWVCEGSPPGWDKIPILFQISKMGFSPINIGIKIAVAMIITSCVEFLAPLWTTQRCSSQDGTGLPQTDIFLPTKT